MNYKKGELGLKELIFFPIKINQFINSIGSFKKGTGVLLILKEFGPMPISHIGERMGIQKSNMTVLVDDLEKNDYIQRRASIEDRRVVNIELTDKGLSFLQAVEEQITSELQDKIEVLKDDEVEAALKAIHLLMSIMSKIIDK